MSPLVRDGDDGARYAHLLLADAALVPGDPQGRRPGRDAGLVVGVPHLLRVPDLHQVAADFAPQVGVVAVKIGVEPFPDGFPAGDCGRDILRVLLGLESLFLRAQRISGSSASLREIWARTVGIVNSAMMISGPTAVRMAKRPIMHISAR